MLFLGESGSETALVPWVVNLLIFLSFPSVVLCLLLCHTSSAFNVLQLIVSLQSHSQAVNQSCTWRKNGVIYFCTQGS